MALVATANGHTYRLRQALFSIVGPTSVVLDSELQPDAHALTAVLNVGAYTVSLGSAWFLERLDPGGFVRVNATLTSPNPVAFMISPAATTSVAFQFATDGTIVTIGSTGTVSITTEVIETTPDAGTAAGGGLMLNEIDYDQVGPDNAEFVEIYNGSSQPIDLASYSLVLVNGSSNAPYLTVGLGSAGMLPSGAYLVVGSGNLLTVPPTALRISFALPNDNIQNGAPDAVALIRTTDNTLVDSLSYEGAITAAALPGVGVANLVEGMGLSASIADSNTVTGSLCRTPNGLDPNDDSASWSFCSSPTPGEANSPATATCGDGVLAPGEQCDGSDLGGQTCVSFGFVGGTLGCSSTCSFDTSGCSSGAGDAAASFSLVIQDYLSWCSVSVNGGVAESVMSKTVTVPAGTVVHVAAQSNSGFVFGYWLGTAGDTTPMHDHASSTTVTVTADTVIQACCAPSSAPGTPCSPPS